MEKAQSKSHHSFPVIKGHLRREQRLSPHKKPHRWDKGQWVQVALREISSWYKREEFIVKTMYQWNNLPMYGSVHDWRFSRHSWTGCQITSSRLSFRQNAGPRWSLQIPSNLGWFIIESNFPYCIISVSIGSFAKTFLKHRQGSKSGNHKELWETGELQEDH